MTPPRLAPRRACCLLLALLALLAAAPSVAQPTTADLPAATLGDPLLVALEPARSGGLAVVDRVLARLGRHQRLLMIGAHPDDEDTALLAATVLEAGGEAAYLSLSRGEGGQNLIGQELGIDLGLLRTRELQAARGIDGARQFFGHAYDFGFSPSLEETLRFWPREELVRDAVRVIRRFRPQVVVAVFPPTPVAGHGQHQASGLAAAEAFRLAGDPAAFPELAAEGLSPWAPTALYREVYADPAAKTLVLAVRGGDPVSGRSTVQVAAASRSAHRSQDMGRLQELGSLERPLAWLAGGSGVAGVDPWAGVDTRLSGLVDLLPAADGERRKAIWRHLTRVEELATGARRMASPAALDAVVPDLGAVLAALAAARQLAAEVVPATDAAAAARRALLDELDEKTGLAATALAAAAGIAVDAWSDRETLVAGATAPPAGLTAVVWSSGHHRVRVERVRVLAAAGWSATELTRRAAEAGAAVAAAPAPTSAVELAPDEVATWLGQLTARGALPSAPYFLAADRQPPSPRLGHALYDGSAVAAGDRGLPFEPPPVRVRWELRVDDVALALERAVVSRRGDQVQGEVRRPLRAVPALEVSLAASAPVMRRAVPRVPLAVELAAHGDSPLTGTVEITVPAGWTPPAPLPFAVRAGGQLRLALDLPVPPGAGSLAATFGATAVLADGRRFAAAYPLVEYPHIAPVVSPRPAAARVELVDVALPELARIGYVRGASDRVPEALRGLGLPVELIAPADLREGDLSRFDAIVLGARAYEVEPAVGEANDRLLDYARGGGLLLVQYQQYAFVEGRFAPLALTIARPHDRVTDETAPVHLLAPEHRLFHLPNLLAAADWDGWVQERGLYFAHDFDPGYTPLLALGDPGREELRGGLLVTPLGRGTYVYTGLAFFRQLPAGVPGAVRLFVNLLGLAETPRR
jgi:LmbE family N-acetylglucosaminyl deacetylase